MKYIFITLKAFFIALFLLFTSYVLTISYLRMHPLKVSKERIESFFSYFASSYKLSTTEGIITTKDFKINFFIPQASLEKTGSIKINLKDTIFSLNLFTLSSLIKTQIIESELLEGLKLFDNEASKDFATFTSQHKGSFNGLLEINLCLLKVKEARLKLQSPKTIHIPNNSSLTQISTNLLNISLHYKNNILEVKQFDLNYSNNTNASLKGKFNFKSNKLVSANFIASINNLSTDYLDGLWPKFLFPKIHDWVVDHIYGGKIIKADASFNFDENDLEVGTKIQKDSINAHIEVDKANLKFYEKFSPIENIHGIITIDGENLNLQASALYNLNTLSNINLNLPFETMKLSLESKFNGEIANFREFLPDKIIHSISNINIDANKIKGTAQGSFELNIPTEEDFDIQKTAIKVESDLDNVIIDENELIRLNHAKLTLFNDSQKLKVQVSQVESKAFEIVTYHELNELERDEINLNLQIHLSKPYNNNFFYLNSGSFNLNAKFSKEKWKIDLNLIRTDFYVEPINYRKEENKEFIFSCEGQLNDIFIATDNCYIKGLDTFSNLEFKYSIEEKSFEKLTLKNAKLGENKFNFSFISEKSFDSISIKAKFLDLSKIDFESNNAHSKNFKININIDEALLKNNIKLNNILGEILKIKKHPLEVRLTSSSEEGKLNISKFLKNDQSIFYISSTPASLFTQAFGIYSNIKKGDLSVEIIPEVLNQKTSYKGKIVINKFFFTNTSILSKIILGIISPLNSPQAIAQSFKGGSLPADSLNANFMYNDNILKFSDFIIVGNSYKIILEGTIDLNKKNVDFKGIYVPSFYGINSFISMLPLFGKLLTGGEKSAFLAANFSIKGDFDKVSSTFHPLSVLTPGFLRKLFH